MVDSSNSDRWINALGRLALNCGAIEHLSIIWLADLVGPAEADQLRKSRFAVRRNIILKELCRSTIINPAKRESAVDVWKSTKEPFRVRNIVLHGGVLQKADGRTYFYKLKESTTTTQHLLFIEKVEQEVHRTSEILKAVAKRD